MKPGEIIDSKYKIKQSIGSGQRAVVYFVEDIKSGEKLVVKILKTTDILKLQRQIKSLMDLNIPETVPILHVGLNAGQVYFVMPYVRGYSLEQLLRSDSGPAITGRRDYNMLLDFFLSITMQIFDNKLYWNIQPDHLLINGNVKRYDKFKLSGFAYVYDVEKGIHFPYMTFDSNAEYMPPELLRDKYCLRQLYYQYAVAAILLSAITGKRFEQDNVDELLSRIPKKFEQAHGALSRALFSNPEKRYPDFKEFYEDAKLKKLFGLF